MLPSSSSSPVSILNKPLLCLPLSLRSTLSTTLGKDSFEKPDFLARTATLSLSAPEAAVIAGTPVEVAGTKRG